MLDVGPGELLIILVIALLVLGPKRLPDAGHAIGKGLREFRQALAGDRDERDEADEALPTESSKRS
jgi:sec-independent protein translocase protein TatA